MLFVCVDCKDVNDKKYQGNIFLRFDRTSLGDKIFIIFSNREKKIGKKRLLARDTGKNTDEQ